jgi:toxin ParE1/3/4
VLRLELSRAADADVDSILDYGAANFGWDEAEAYAQSFHESFALLSEYPEMGAVYPGIRPPVRSWGHGSHRIFYAIYDDTIIIRRILHQSVDVKRWLE